MKFLKNHPFAVEAFFENSTVLTFAVPKEELTALIPPCLELDSFQNRWAFIAVAMVQTKHLRPAGLPKFMGNNFFLIGYRIFVRFTTQKQKRLRGLYILKSETDKKKMEILGNIFTHYKYSTTDIQQIIDGNEKRITSVQSGFDIQLDIQEEPADLPESSPFSDWKEARRFAGPLPHTFTFLADDNSVLVILGKRQNWKPKAIGVKHYELDFLQKLKVKGIRLASAFEISNIPYRWEKGRIEKWK